MHARYLASHLLCLFTGLVLVLTPAAAQISGVVAAGDAHTLFVKADGVLWAMGTNDYGQLCLGGGSSTRITLPTPGATGVSSVSAGYSYTMFVKTDGTLWAAGYNSSGQLGDGTSGNQRAVPVQVATGVATVAVGDESEAHTLFIRTDGTLWATGANTFGQLGDGTTTSRALPVQVATGVAAVSTGASHTVFIKTDGTLWAVGANALGQLGDGTIVNRLTPVQVASGVASVSAGAGHTMFIKTDGTLWAAGYNYSGQLGDGTNASRFSPVQIATGVASVSARREFTMFVKTDGTLWGTGYNTDGQLGLGDTVNRIAPTKVTTAGVTFVKAGAHHSLFLLADGSLWATGLNTDGQLGVGDTVNRTSPVRVSVGVSLGTIAPTIATQPVSQSVLIGASITFTIVATGSPAPAYQWSRNGTPIAGATGSTLTITNVQIASAGAYLVTATNVAGADTSSVATLSVAASVTDPTITTPPADQSVVVGGNATFSVTATGTAPLTYQWLKDGREIVGATSSTFAINGVTRNDAGSYAVIVRNSLGAVTSRSASLTVSDLVSRIVNMSVRTVAGTGSETLIVGFVVTGVGAAKPVLVRGIGPTLTAFGVGGVLADPELSLYKDATLIATNDNWGASPDVVQITSVAAASGAFALAPTSKDAVLYAVLQPGSYSAKVSGRDGTGTALVELYDTYQDLSTKVANVSARSVVGPGDAVLIAGFVITGNGPKNILLRAIGPSLAVFGVTGILRDPQLVLYRGSEVFATNDDWSSGDGAQTLPSIFASVGAFGLVSGTKDAALTARLPPGAYSAKISSADSSTGVALIEVYELP